MLRSSFLSFGAQRWHKVVRISSAKTHDLLGVSRLRFSAISLFSGYESIAVSEALDQMDMFQVRLRIWGDTAERRHQFGAFKGLLSNSVAADKASATATATANNINDGPAEESGRDSSIDELME
ncbi:MAG: hypothetical protein ACI84R_000294 [Candidatus Azotimanducaceae bacterium]